MTPMANHKTAIQETSQYWIGIFKNGFMLKSSEINVEKPHDMNLKSIADIKRSMSATLFWTDQPDCANIAASKTRKAPRRRGFL